MAINFNKVEFILSAASEKQFVRDGMPQLAFAGRSNVGKSSVINRLVNRKNFARVGSQPKTCALPTCRATATPRSPRPSATAGAS